MSARQSRLRAAPPDLLQLEVLRHSCFPAIQLLLPSGACWRLLYTTAMLMVGARMLSLESYSGAGCSTRLLKNGHATVPAHAPHHSSCFCCRRCYCCYRYEELLVLICCAPARIMPRRPRDQHTCQTRSNSSTSSIQSLDKPRLDTPKSLNGIKHPKLRLQPAWVLRSREDRGGQPRGLHFPNKGRDDRGPLVQAAATIVCYNISTG